MIATPLVHLVGGLTAIALLAACAPRSDASASRAPDGELRADLEALARRTVFFGHQSVGTNIVDGLRDLAAQEGVGLRILETRTAERVAPGTYAHAFVGENGKPAAKLQAFQDALGAGPAPVDVALVKFCYVDVEKDTDVGALFDRYRVEMQALQARHPATTFVHVTVPITEVQGGLKAMVKDLLGREPYGWLENVRREEFNALMREAFADKEPLFDLARFEATGPDGTLATVERDGRRVPVLVEAYTDDGGHLNGEGRRRVARALVDLIASLPPRAR
jgi:hypothetical protein